MTALAPLIALGLIFGAIVSLVAWSGVRGVKAAAWTLGMLAGLTVYYLIVAPDYIPW